MQQGLMNLVWYIVLYHAFSIRCISKSMQNLAKPYESCAWIMYIMQFINKSIRKTYKCIWFLASLHAKLMIKSMRALQIRMSFMLSLTKAMQMHVSLLVGANYKFIWGVCIFASRHTHELCKLGLQNHINSCEANQCKSSKLKNSLANQLISSCIWTHRNRCKAIHYKFIVHMHMWFLMSSIGNYVKNIIGQDALRKSLKDMS